MAKHEFSFIGWDKRRHDVTVEWDGHEAVIYDSIMGRGRLTRRADEYGIPGTQPWAAAIAMGLTAYPEEIEWDK